MACPGIGSLKNQAYIEQHVRSSGYSTILPTDILLLGFALYRALLRQAPNLPLKGRHRNVPQQKIRSRLGNTFRHNAIIQGQAAVKRALRQGYEVLHHQCCSG